MINFIDSNSPFYHENKEYIQQIIVELEGYAFSGWVNAYGFDIEGRSEKNNHTYFLQLKKHQTTQNGNFIPMNAHVNTEIEIMITGLKDQGSYSYGIGFPERLFTLTFSRSTSPLSKQLNIFAETFGIKRLLLNKGRLTLKVSNSAHAPAMIIDELEKVLS